MQGEARQVAQLVLDAQRKVIGNVAISLALRVDGITVSDSGTVSVEGDAVDAVDRLVRGYSKFSGPLGVRMCFDAARDVLIGNPGLDIPVFRGLIDP